MKIPNNKQWQFVCERSIIPFILFCIFTIIYYLFTFPYITFSFIGLIVGLSCLLLALIIFAYSRTTTHLIWALFNISVAAWGFGCFCVGNSGSNYNLALISWKLFIAGITFIPVFCYHFVTHYTGVRLKGFLFFVYLQAILFSAINVSTNLFIDKLVFLFGEFYYLQANILYTFYFIVWSIIVLVSFIILFNYYYLSVGLKRVQSAYLFYGMLLGFFGGGTTAPQAWGFVFYPSGLFLTCIYAAISTYAIFKYQLINIKVAITRISVFVSVYSFVLGVPFALAFALDDFLQIRFGVYWWLPPMILLTVLATGGPFIYLAIQRRAEEKLFQDQRRYQSTLRQASTGMGRIKDMDKLLDMIVRVVTRSVRIEHSFIYLNDRKAKTYKLEASRFRSERVNLPQEIPAESRVVKALKKMRAPIVYSEIQQRAQDFDDEKLRELEGQMAALQAELIVPCFIEDKLIAIMAMGKKVSGELYSQDDLAVFMILSNQAGLAIENAQFYKDMRATHEQLFRAEKMATIGIMADGLSHQINNRLHALGFIAGDALDTIQMNKKLKMTDEVKEMMVDIEHALTRIQENVSQGGEIVRGLLKYSRKSDEQFGEVELDELIDEAVTMAQFKIKTGEMLIVRDFEPGLPKIHGNFTQLQEVFFNMIDNAYDAMMQRKTDLKEEGYEPRITIKAERSRMGSMRIVLEDNGIGIRAEDQEKIFTPFFTTKLSSKKGTGLGLYVIQKLIEENHKGKVFYKSEYAKGTRVYITLPTVEGLDQDAIQSVERKG